MLVKRKANALMIPEAKVNNSSRLSSFILTDTVFLI